MQTRADVRVVCRFRPLRESEIEVIEKEAPGVPLNCVTYDEAHVEVLDRYEGITIGEACTALGRDDRMKAVANRTLRDLGKSFTLDAIVGAEQTQDDMYALIGAPVVHNVIEGYNGTVLAYGQTGSGKTHSMIGPEGGTQAFFGNTAESESFASVQVQNTFAASGASSSLNSPASVGSPPYQPASVQYANRGLVPRVVEGIFNRLSEFDPAERTWTLRLCIFEIYREEIIDLLGAVPAQRLRTMRARQRDPSPSASHTSRTTSPTTVTNGAGGTHFSRPRSGAPGSHTTGGGPIVPPKPEYRIREDIVGGRGVYVESLESVMVVNAAEVLMLIHEAMLRRRTSATNANETSSRSHSLVVLTLEQLDKSASPEGVHIASRLNLVDLAGSEKLSKTHADGDRLKEAQTINLSLTLLGNVIHRLTDGRSGYIPYRDSKLTRLLQDSLGGNSITTLLCHCSTSMLDREETLSTLRFAQRAKRVRNKPRLNRDLTAKEMGLQLAEAQQRVDMLEKELQLHREVRSNLRDKQAKDKRELEKRHQALIDTLNREIQQLREELRLTAGELVHEKDRVQFQRREKEQLAQELAALKASHASENAALENALRDSQQQNQKLANDLEALHREMQDFRTNRSVSSARHLSPGNASSALTSGRGAQTRDVGVNTEALTPPQVRQLMAVLRGECGAGDDDDAQGSTRLLGSDEVQRAVHAAGTLIASMAQLKKSGSEAAATQDDRETMAAAVAVLEQVMLAVSKALAEDANSTEPTTMESAARRAELQRTLQLASRLLSLWMACGGEMDMKLLCSHVNSDLVTPDMAAGAANSPGGAVVQDGHVLARDALSPLLRAVEDLLAGDLQQWCAVQHSPCVSVATWKTAAHAAHDDALSKAKTALSRSANDDSLPKAKAAMSEAVKTHLTAQNTLTPVVEVDTEAWLHTHWVQDVFGPEGFVSSHTARTATAVSQALQNVVAEHVAAFATAEEAHRLGYGHHVAHKLEQHVSAALEQAQLNGEPLTAEHLSSLFAGLESAVWSDELEDQAARRHSSVSHFEAALFQALRETSKQTYRQEDARLKEALTSHASDLLAKLHEDVAAGKALNVEAATALMPSLLAVAQEEAVRVGPLQHKHLLRALRGVGKEACASYERHAAAEDKAAVDALMAHASLLCSKMQTVMLVEHAPPAVLEGKAEEDRSSLNADQLDKVVRQLHTFTPQRIEASARETGQRAMVPLSASHSATTVLTGEAWQQLATFLSAYTPTYVVVKAGQSGEQESYVVRQIQGLLLPDLARCYEAAQAQPGSGTLSAPATTEEWQLVRALKSHVRHLVFPSEDGSTSLSVCGEGASSKLAAGAVTVTRDNAGRLLYALAQALQAHLAGTHTSEEGGARHARRVRVADLLSALAHVVNADDASSASARGQSRSQREGSNGGVSADCAAGAAPSSPMSASSVWESLTEDEAQQVRLLLEQLAHVIDNADEATLMGMETWLQHCLECADAQQREAAICAALSALGISLSQTALRSTEVQLTTVRVSESLDVVYLSQQLALIESSLASPSAGGGAIVPYTQTRSSASVSFQSDSQLVRPPQTCTVVSVHDALVLLQHLSGHALGGGYNDETSTTTRADALTRAPDAAEGRLQVLENALDVAERRLSQRSGGTHSLTCSARSPSPLMLTGPLPLSPPPITPIPQGCTVTHVMDAGTATEPFWEADTQLQHERDAHMRKELTVLLQLLGIDAAEVCGLQPGEVDLLEALMRAREEVSFIKNVEAPAQTRALEEREKALSCIYDAVKDTQAELENLRTQVQMHALMEQLNAAATGTTATTTSAATAMTADQREALREAGAPIPATASGSLHSRVAQNLQKQMDLAAVLATSGQEAKAQAPSTEVELADLHTPTTATTHRRNSGCSSSSSASPDLRRIAARYENPLLRPWPDVNVTPTMTTSAATPDGKPSHVRNPQCLMPPTAALLATHSGALEADESGSPLSALARSRRHSSCVRPSTTASLIALATVTHASPNKYANPLSGTGVVPQAGDGLGLTVAGRGRLNELSDAPLIAMAETGDEDTDIAAPPPPCAARKADLAPAVTHECLTSCLHWTEGLVIVFCELQRQAEMARLRAERLDEVLFKSRDERDDCRQELDALKLVVAALRQENDQMRHVLHDLNIDLETYMSSLAYQERLNKVLAEEADRERNKAERLRTTAEQQEFCEMGAVELAMKSEDTLEIEIGLRQVLTYTSADLVTKKRAHLSKSLQKLDTFCKRMLSLLQLRPYFNTGTLESQRLNLLQGLGDLMERIASAKDELRHQEMMSGKRRSSSDSAGTSFPTLPQRAVAANMR